MRARTFAQRSTLNTELEKLGERVWPEFVFHGDEYQFALINESDQVIAGGRTGLLGVVTPVRTSVADWQRWTGVEFEHTGAYVVPGALVPVEINLESDTGTYVEPSVWYLHSLS